MKRVYEDRPLEVTSREDRPLEVTSREIRELRDEAGVAGDRELVAICTRALGGEPRSRAECQEIIRGTRALAAAS